MTGRVHSLTVVLEHDMRTDDVEGLADAIHRMRGVLDVTQHVSDPTAYMAEQRARHDLGQKIWEVIYPKEK